MALIYVSNGAWGTGQGAPLTAAQHDGNVYTLALGIAALEASLAATMSITDITSAGNIVTFHLSDGSTIPIAFELPGFRHRGAWTNSTAYAVNDIVTQDGLGAYIVLVAHTSAASPAVFDPSAVDSETDGAGSESLFGLLLGEPDLARMMRWMGDSFPAEQTLEQYDVFKDDTYGTYIVNSDHTSAATFDPLAVDSDSALLYTQIAPPAFAAVEEISATTHTISNDDSGKYFRYTNASGCMITFDDGLTVGSETHHEQASAGIIDFTSGTGADIIPQRTLYDTASPYQGAVITAKVVSDSAVKLIGPHGSATT